MTSSNPISGAATAASPSASVPSATLEQALNPLVDYFVRLVGERIASEKPQPAATPRPMTENEAMEEEFTQLRSLLVKHPDFAPVASQLIYSRHSIPGSISLLHASDYVSDERKRATFRTLKDALLRHAAGKRHGLPTPDAEQRAGLAALAADEDGAPVASEPITSAQTVRKLAEFASWLAGCRLGQPKGAAWPTPSELLSWIHSSKNGPRWSMCMATLIRYRTLAEKHGYVTAIRSSQYVHLWPGPNFPDQLLREVEKSGMGKNEAGYSVVDDGESIALQSNGGRIHTVALFPYEQSLMADGDRDRALKLAEGMARGLQPANA